MKIKTAVLLLFLAAAVVAGGVWLVTAHNKADQSASAQPQTAAQGTLHTRPTRVACVGDSITSGYRLADKTNAYPARLGRLLGNGYIVDNFGVAGRAVQTQSDKPYEEEPAFQNSLLFTPNIVIIMFGTNDTKPVNWNAQRVKAEYAALVQTYASLPTNPRIIIMTPPPLFFNFTGEYAPNRETLETELVPLIRELAKEQHLECIDLYRAFEEQDSLFPDGCHPNEEGAAVIAQAVFAHLRQKGENK